mmetsp:Transcript_442/g.731  ORF Transcript_442/g.731 Transcript_442/m.731 type:complete len:137 (+) Transcript_442:73-483(+)
MKNKTRNSDKDGGEMEPQVKPPETEKRISKEQSAWYGIYAGLFGASASVFGKGAFDKATPFTEAGTYLLVQFILPNLGLAAEKEETFHKIGILGRLIFKERISRVWWLGAVCIYGGIILLASASTTSNSKKNKKQD